jgi:hypothetical protein
MGLTSHKMTFTREQRKSAYRQLPPEVQNFIMDNETTEIIEKILTKAGVVGDQNDQADSEVLYTMYGLQNLDTAIQNIAKLSGKSAEQLRDLRMDLQEEIFNKIPKVEINSDNKDFQSEKKARQNNVGNKFEEMVMNQKRGMMPAIDPNEKVGDVPQNLPTEQKVIHDYTEKSDPYREPLG